MSTDLHAVFATDFEHNTYRVSDVLSWEAAQFEWNRLDENRRNRLLPQVKFFEVRSVTLGPDRALVGPEVRSHDRYDKAPLNLNMTKVVLPGKGFADIEDAARKAWKLFAPTFRSRYDRSVDDRYGKTGVQGSGGWYFYPNGQTVAQGLRSLALVCRAKGLVVQGGNGRWYVTDLSK